MPQKPHIEFAWVAIGQCLAMLGLLATTKVLSTSVSPAELGHFMLALTIVVAINQRLFGPYKLALSRFHAKMLKTSDASAFKAVAVDLQLKLAFKAVLLVLLITLRLNQTRLSVSTSLPLITGLFGVFTSWNSITTLFFDNERRRLQAALFKAGEVWLWLILCLLLTHYFFSNALYIASAYAVAALAFALPTFLKPQNALTTTGINYAGAWLYRWPGSLSPSGGPLPATPQPRGLATSLPAQCLTFFGKGLFELDADALGRTHHFVPGDLQQAAVHGVGNSFFLHSGVNNHALKVFVFDRRDGHCCIDGGLEQ